MTGAALQLPSSPFRGIEPYRFVDAPIFFARNADALDLLRSVIIYKGVLLYGNSGTGKSSLINAGLFPEVLDKGLCPDRIRLQNRLNGEIIVERVSLNDNGQAPFLSPSLADGPSGAAAMESRVVLSLAQFKERLAQYAPQNRALLIFDQFEELITLFEEAPAQSALRDALTIQQNILNLIVEILHGENYPVKVLFAFREDYLAKLNKLFVLAPELPPQYLRLTLPRPNVLKDIIGGPFKDKLREHFGPKSFSPKLINSLISDFTVRSESDEVNLFEVQIVCQELWDSTDSDKTYTERSGVPGLLKNYFDRQISKLAADGLSDAAVALLSEMVTPAGTRNVISQYTLVEQVKKSTGLSEDILKKALAALVKDTGLVRGDLHRDSLYYEITSESMSPWILQKRKDRVDRELNEQAERAQREYYALLRRQRTRSLLLVSIATGVAFLILLGALWIYRVNTRSQLYAAQQLEVQETKARLDEIRSSLDLLRHQTEIAETDKATAYRAVYEKTQAIDRLTKEKEALEQALQNQQPLLLTRGEAPRKRNVDRRSTMFGSTTLDIAIGLIMVFLLLSLVCTAVNE
ncbi:MAG TPA: hypothetical protein VHP99_07185, partial [Pyrinomonadaceae bacterium]|nr:hypothetical protein [Pyrinomonadaceae bacterium]